MGNPGTDERIVLLKFSQHKTCVEKEVAWSRLLSFGRDCNCMKVVGGRKKQQGRPSGELKLVKGRRLSHAAYD